MTGMARKMIRKCDADNNDEDKEDDEYFFIKNNNKNRTQINKTNKIQMS